MATHSRDRDQLLAPDVLLRLMTYLANLVFPAGWKETTEQLVENRARGTYLPADGSPGRGLFGGNKPELNEVVYDPGEKPQFVTQLRECTQRYWPELWNNEVQACRLLKQIQTYLRRFWREPDQHARDWYIHRARNVVQRFRVQHELGDEFHRPLETVNDALRLNARIEELLDDPPVRIPFEEALYELQRRVVKRSKRPLYCPNDSCKRRYFLSEKKGTKYCSSECFQADSGRPSKRKSWHAHKEQWRKQ